MIKPSLGQYTSGRFRHHSRMRGCVAYWSLVENGGLALYNYARPGLYSGALTASSADPSRTIGKYGPNLTFDGSNDIAVLSNSTDLDFPNQTFSISLIYKATVAGYIIARRHGVSIGSDGGYFIRINSDGTLTARILEIGNTPASECISTGTQYLDGNYHTLSVIFTTDTVTIPGNTISLYADSILDGVLAPGTFPYSPLADNLVLGATSDSTGFLTGSIEEVRIYDRALTYGEVLSYYLDPYLEFNIRRIHHNDLSSSPVTSISSRRLLVGVGV